LGPVEVSAVALARRLRERVMCHVSHVTSHTSYVTRHTSHVTRQTSHAHCLHERVARGVFVVVVHCKEERGEGFEGESEGLVGEDCGGSGAEVVGGHC